MSSPILAVLRHYKVPRRDWAYEWLALTFCGEIPDEVDPELLADLPQKLRREIELYLLEKCATRVQ